MVLPPLGIKCKNIQQLIDELECKSQIMESGCGKSQIIEVDSENEVQSKLIQQIIKSQKKLVLQTRKFPFACDHGTCTFRTKSELGLKLHMKKSHSPVSKGNSKLPDFHFFMESEVKIQAKLLTPYIAIASKQWKKHKI